MNLRNLIIMLFQMVIMIGLLSGCSILAIREFDRIGNEYCRDGIWEGKDLCPDSSFVSASSFISTDEASSKENKHGTTATQ